MGIARLFLFIFCLIISNKVVGNVQGKTLICDKDRRGYNFISKDKVEVLSINFYKLNIISINHSYELAENAIFIYEISMELNIETKPKPIGWIFRRNLDYVGLVYVNGDWSRKFFWSCEVIPLKVLKTRLKNKLNKLKKVSEKKLLHVNP